MNTVNYKLKYCEQARRQDFVMGDGGGENESVKVINSSKIYNLGKNYR